MPWSSLRSLILSALLGSFAFGLTGAPARAESTLVLTPSAGIENGGPAFGINLRDFFLPNLAWEIDGGYGLSLCQDCQLSETTLTGNLVYEIHPFESLSFFLVAGGGVGFLDLSSPQSGRATLGLVDAGLGSRLFLTSHLSLTLEDRWFIPISGALPGVQSGSLTADRIFLGVSTAF